MAVNTVYEFEDVIVMTLLTVKTVSMFSLDVTHVNCDSWRCPVCDIDTTVGWILDQCLAR